VKHVIYFHLTTDTNTQIFVSILDCCLLNFDAGHKKVVFYDFDTNFKTKNLSRGRFLVRAAKEEHHYTYTNAAAAIAYMTREYLKNG